MKKYIFLGIFLSLISVCAKADNWDYYGVNKSKKYPVYLIEQPVTKANFYITPRLGISYLTLTENFSNMVGLTGGLSAGVYVNNFRFEAEINKHFKRHFKQHFKQSSKRHDTYLSHLEQTDLFLNAFYDFHQPIVTPFVGVGLGRLSLKDNCWWRVSQTSRAWAVSFTGGISRAITPNIAFEGLGRLKYAFKMSGALKDEDYFNLELLAGVRFSF